MPTGIYKHKKLSEETKKKIGLANIGNKKALNNHHTLSVETKRKQGLAKKGIKQSKEHIRKIVESKRKNGSYIFSDKTKEKMRIASFNYAKKVAGIVCPRLGHNEKQILDRLENKLNCKIIRQYKCKGYFIDGYIKEINVAIEVDERPKIKNKDLEREKIIKNKLNCKFIRIKDYD